MPVYTNEELEDLKSRVDTFQYEIIKHRNEYIKEIFNTHKLPIDEAELIAVHRIKKNMEIPPKIKERLFGVPFKL